MLAAQITRSGLSKVQICSQIHLPAAVAGVGVPVMTHLRCAVSCTAMASLFVRPKLAPRLCPSSISTLSQWTCKGSHTEG